ncbi:MAG: hypothetical protein GC179_04645 [Anaerolineaceae bacterium]|nr:hypothetical protein [Anaerolineaceae bacterium]
MSSSPTVTEVDQIAALVDPVIRNLQITQSYHELALVMTSRTGICANWCTFATWASKQAGQTIRKEDFARLLDDIRRSIVSAQTDSDIVAAAQAFGSKHSGDEIQETVADVLNPLAALDRASDAVARGNRKVYAEIGREFARFFATCLNDNNFDSAKITEFCKGLRPGDPPDGQQYLAQAFTYYYRAFFERDVSTRAQLLLLANILIGFHEQTRLQPEIAEAMNAAFIDARQFRTRFIKALFPFRGWLARLRLFFLRLINRPSPFDGVIDDLLNQARRLARLVITRYMMTLGLPHDVILHLGQDVPAEFPESLRHISFADLQTLLTQIDPTPDSTHDSGTVDWSQLPQRLHFIIDLFRCYQETSDLFDPPFTTEQVTSLKSGRLPDGRL